MQSPDQPEYELFGYVIHYYQPDSVILVVLRSPIDDWRAKHVSSGEPYDPVGTFGQNPLDPVRVRQLVDELSDDRFRGIISARHEFTFAPSAIRLWYDIAEIESWDKTTHVLGNVIARKLDIEVGRMLMRSLLPGSNG